MHISRTAIFLLALPLLLNCLPLYSMPVRAESNEATAVNASFGREYAVPNGPRNLAAEAPGRIWYTATEAGGIGFLEVISDEDDPVVRYRTEFYGFGEHSQPYDLVYHDGVVWFTLRGVRALGKIDVETREIKLFTLLSVGAAPTGIDVEPSGRLWLAQSNGRISSFDPTTETFTEYILPGHLVGGAPRMEDVAFQDARNVWFTMPDANRVISFDPVNGGFFGIATDNLTPMGIAIAPNGGVWVTANGSSTVGRFVPTTVTIWVWYDTPTPDSGPVGLLAFEDEDGLLQLWMTESNTGTIGRLQIYNNFAVGNRERLGPVDPTGSTWGIIRSPDGHIWVADTGRNLLYELTEPFIHRIYAAWIETSENSEVPEDQ